MVYDAGDMRFSTTDPKWRTQHVPPSYNVLGQPLIAVTLQHPAHPLKQSLTLTGQMDAQMGVTDKSRNQC